MHLSINGDTIAVPTSVDTISRLINYFQIENPVVIVEHNNQILEKEDHDQTHITDGDKVELIQFLGGG